MKAHKHSFLFTDRLFGCLIRQERGAILVEELVTVAVIGLGLSILVAMIATGAIGVRIIDDQVKAEFIARSQLELIKDAPYEADPVSSPYPTPLLVPGYSSALTIRYWDASTTSFTTAVRNDGLQELTVTVSRNGSQLVSLTGFKGSR